MSRRELGTGTSEGKRFTFSYPAGGFGTPGCGERTRSSTACGGGERDAAAGI
ncbi:hypothetical protein ONA91_03655 [Micromonospora sp. DR5-3]|uniref:hypothetical protein n=1 Tax=unclassified Micromonospora TaxID=2617518 RepID=UPI001651F89C|nr:MULTISPECIES: hypothetical protein [unclassified Micromonospora]MCW3813555.1 hypothetical protein [Micromonospora sp. DR5-3]